MLVKFKVLSEPDFPHATLAENPDEVKPLAQPITRPEGAYRRWTMLSG